ncbi:hypothetical protein ACM1RC_26750 [Paenibacillus azoreducens]|uniref:hypothetical protein n=1 Tax=Paenibacillus azoreducens TaxID=116718 RepID=UPI0039F4E52B
MKITITEVEHGNGLEVSFEGETHSISTILGMLERAKMLAWEYHQNDLGAREETTFTEK